MKNITFHMLITDHLIEISNLNQENTLDQYKEIFL